MKNKRSIRKEIKKAEQQVNWDLVGQDVSSNDIQTRQNTRKIEAITNYLEELEK